MASVMTSKLPRQILATSDPETLAAEILRALKYRVGKDMTVATPYDWLTASIKVVRDRIIDQWISSTKEAYDRQATQLKRMFEENYRAYAAGAPEADTESG